MGNKIKSLIKKLAKLGHNIKANSELSYDPVCGMRATSDLFKADYQGKGYNFCSDHCKSQFEANPANFA